MNSQTVLVIDDDKGIRDLVRIMLELDGHTVLEAANGADGLELACRHRPDLVILDYMMPGQTGERTGVDLGQMVPSATVVAFSAGLVGKPYWADLYLSKSDIGCLPEFMSGLCAGPRGPAGGCLARGVRTRSPN